LSVGFSTAVFTAGSTSGLSPTSPSHFISDFFSSYYYVSFSFFAKLGSYSDLLSLFSCLAGTSELAGVSSSIDFLKSLVFDSISFSFSAMLFSFAPTEAAYLLL